MSPSSRRAWIEINHPRPESRTRSVALLAEGVDRNLGSRTFTKITGAVALLAEGVDRNRASRISLAACSRSPSSRRAWIEIPRP